MSLVASKPNAPQSPEGLGKESGWDCRLFALRAVDRPSLLAKIDEVSAFIEAQPDTDFAVLAASLAQPVDASGVRLAIVATTVEDLGAKLQKARKRLGEASCKFIRDHTGIYFFDAPLGLQGKVAWVFPGEGAQYPNMLQDLCSLFPQVEEAFGQCERIAADSGNREDSIRSLFHLGRDPSPERIAEAEIRLRKLGPSIFGVLIADLAIGRLLEALRVPVDATAGHSAGEIAALLASGSMQGEDALGSKLGEIMNLMESIEETAGGPEAALLAVGTGKEVVESLARELVGDAVMVAMDNCPHQCVAVGLPDQVAQLEGAITGKGFICERLPFRRPYHTPLFEPWMEKFRQLFDNVPFERPRIPTYCCSTGKLFPGDPEQIKTLAVNHWVSPVEFAAMIKTMHADGVRVFVEVGPRGNLSAFIEDILRGQSFAAIPANVARKSGPTQINLMAAQLFAHHVPLDLQALFGDMTSQEEGSLEEPPQVPAEPQLPEIFEPQSFDPFACAGGDVMDQHFALMEQFLIVQDQVMGAYLRSSKVKKGAFNIPSLGLTKESPDPLSDAPELDSFTSRPRFALIDEVEFSEPGTALVARRRLDKSEDLYAEHHTLGGRGVSRADPDQKGLPILPMTFTMEAMSQAASLLCPGKVVVAIRNLRLFRWVPFDAQATTFEIRAEIVQTDPETGLVEVRANTRDLGNSFLADGASKPAAEATVILADAYPEPAEPLPFALADERPCRVSVEQLRMNMFHGPLFQMIRSLDRFGKQGIDGTIEVQPRDGWFQTNANPHLATDPALIDAGMHILGAWHLEQPDWSGRILLPIGIDQVEFFGPNPEVGQLLALRGHNEEETARKMRHGLEILDNNGRVWMRMKGAAYWRFYLPFGEVNYFGPKDLYVLSQPFPAAEGVRQDGATAGACYYLDHPADLKQQVLRTSGSRVAMTPAEQEQYNTWEGTDAQLNDWFFGKLALKDAVRGAWTRKHGTGLFPADIDTGTAPSGAVTCTLRDIGTNEPLPSAAYAVLPGKACAFAAYRPHVGIAMEAIPKKADDLPLRELAARNAVKCALKRDDLELQVMPRGGVEGVYLVSVPGGLEIPHSGQTLRVQTSRRNDLILATTECEVEPS